MLVHEAQAEPVVLLTKAELLDAEEIAERLGMRGFEVAGLDRVVAITRATNGPGQRSLEKFGMTREREWTTDEGRTLVLYAIVRPGGPI